MVEPEHASGLVAIGVNWKLLLTQIINFSILLWLLKRYALSPVVKALDRRRKTIREGLQAAKQNLERETKTKRKLAKLEEEALSRSQKLLAKTKQEAQDERKRILEQAKKEQEQVIARARLEISRIEKAQFEKGKRKLRYLTAIATKKVLGKVLAPKIDEQFIKEMLKKT